MSLYFKIDFLFLQIENKNFPRNVPNGQLWYFIENIPRTSFEPFPEFSLQEQFLAILLEWVKLNDTFHFGSLPDNDTFIGVGHPLGLKGSEIELIVDVLKNLWRFH